MIKKYCWWRRKRKRVRRSLSVYIDFIINLYLDFPITIRMDNINDSARITIHITASSPHDHHLYHHLCHYHSSRLVYIVVIFIINHIDSIWTFSVKLHWALFQQRLAVLALHYILSQKDWRTTTKTLKKPKKTLIQQYDNTTVIPYYIRVINLVLYHAFL